MKPPPQLCEAECKEWRRVLAELLKSGVQVEPADRSLLTVWTQTWCLREKCLREVAQIGGEVVKTPVGGAALNCWQSLAMRCDQTLMRLSKDLCLSPASRNRLGVEQ